MICGVVQPHQSLSGADGWGPGPLTRDWDFYTMKSGDATHGRSGYNLTLGKAKAAVEKDCDR